MNTPKIAALYAASNYALIVKYAGADNDVSETFAWGLHRAILFDDRLPSTDASQPEKYRVTINDGERRKRLNVIGDTEYGLADTLVPARVFDWAMGLMPTEGNQGVPDILFVGLHAQYSKAAGKDDTHVMQLASASRFGGLLRGILAYEKKRLKYFKKTLKQLAVYHQQLVEKAAAEEAAMLKRGVWGGVEKAITTAARVSEPGIPFMGDTSLTHEDREALDLRYYSVYKGVIGAGADAFPAGTGIALKPVKRSRELVDGAVYLWQWMVDGRAVTTMLGRLDMSAKKRGHLPLRLADTGQLPTFCWAPWNSEAVTLFRVTHYTTRAAEELAPMVAETQPAQQQPAKRQKRRELACAA